MRAFSVLVRLVRRAADDGRAAALSSQNSRRASGCALTDPAILPTVAGSTHSRVTARGRHTEVTRGQVAVGGRQCLRRAGVGS